MENQNPAIVHESAGSPKRGSIATNFGAIGWVAYWAFTIHGWWIGGAIAGLAVFAVILAHEYSRAAVKLMDCVSAAFFAFAAIVAALAGPWLFLRYNIFMIWGVFAVVAWITILIGRPFTLQYAHEQTPPEIWDHPLFKQFNVFLTLIWCGILTVNTLFGFAAFLTGRIISLGLLIPLAIFIAGLVFSRLYPKLFDAQFATAAAAAPESSRRLNPR